MHSCKLDTPIFVGATEFEFEETEDGFFVHTFVISNQVNANQWMVTSEANKQDGTDFEGKPDILFFNDKGIKDHTTGKTKEESLRVQEPFRKGTIKKIKGTETGKRLTATSKIDDERTKQLIRSNDIRFVSPAIFPKSLEDVEIVRTGPNSHIHIVHRYDALHVAFVDDPAYGVDALVGPTCEGNGKDCMIRLQQLKAGIGDDDVDPLREVELVVSKCEKTGNLIIEMEASELSEEVSKCLSQKLGPGESPTDQDLAICFSEARDKLKQSKAKESKSATASFKSGSKYSKTTLGNEEETKKKVEELESKAQEIEETLKGIKKAQEETKEEKDKAAKKAQEEEEKKQQEARKSGKGKKAEDMTDEEKKAQEKEEEEKTAQEEEKKEKDIVAKVASEMSIKSPLVEKYIQAKTAQKGLDEKAQSELRVKMLSASVEDIKSKLDDVGAFAGLNKSSGSEIGMGGVQGDGQFSASTNYDNLSGEELEEKAMGSVI